MVRADISPPVQGLRSLRRLPELGKPLLLAEYYPLSSVQPHMVLRHCEGLREEHYLGILEVDTEAPRSSPPGATRRG